jgi:tetratricopeptide (TPR) repeat protein
MKKTILFATFALLINGVFAQKNAADLHKSMFATAMLHRDVGAAIMAGNYVVTLEGDKSTYLDSLAYLYLAANQIQSCQIVCDRVLKNEPEKLSMIELKGRCLVAENRVFDAIAAYETLFKKTNDISFGFALARLQYTGKRLTEALLTFNSALTLKAEDDKKEKVNVAEVSGNKGQTQSVFIKAAMHNLRGLIVYDLDPNKNKKEAATCFEEALKLEPTYVLAKQNKETLATIEGAKTPAATSTTAPTTIPPTTPTKN